MTTITRDLGTIGAVGGLHVDQAGKIAITLYRAGGVWDLSGYTAPTLDLQVVDTPDLAAVAVNGTVTIVTAASGIVAYEAGASDLIYAASGSFIGRVWVTHDGDEIPSDPFRFHIDAGPAAA
jgi:hypothetical protein